MRIWPRSKVRPRPLSSIRLLTTPGLIGNEPIGALAHLGLARTYVLSGDTAKAMTAYQGFLTLWKDADSDIPISE
jgi:hypothetical protein